MHIRFYEHEIDAAEALVIFDRTFHISHSFLGRAEQTEARQHLGLLLRHSEALLAEIEGKVIGFIAVDDEGYISALYVDRPHAGRGVGSALLQAAQDHHDSLGLHVFAENISAVQFYRARGFAVVGEDRQIDSLGRRHDRLEMERHSYQSMMA
ncbi:GNAT family N-acetyltransferase [Methylobacterium nigriterrae]|uniref:GNAT family N-acetyltransferase n=1 Tax=Methylobacterium nigriterrae TaxID=3127512 RepID=UPI003013496D